MILDIPIKNILNALPNKKENRSTKKASRFPLETERTETHSNLFNIRTSDKNIRMKTANIILNYYYLHELLLYTLILFFSNWKYFS